MPTHGPTGPSGESSPGASLEQQLAQVLARLDGFPLERFARMEAELRQLKAMVREEAGNNRRLAEESHRLAVGLHEAIQRQLDRAFTACQRERNQHVGRLSDRIESVEQRWREERSVSIRLKLAMIGAGSALAVSLAAILLNWLLGR